MTEQVRVGGAEPDGYVRFWSTGQVVKGEFHCAECGYGVTVYRALPTCPMCGGEAWEQFPWSPFTRAVDSPLQ
jgi:rubrerythrin